MQQPGGDRRHVFGALTERRHIDPQRRQPPIDIATQPVGAHLGFDAGRRAGQQSHAERRRLAVDPRFAIADDARQACLDAGRQIGDVFEKQRAAARRGDPTVGGERLEILRRVTVGFAEERTLDRGHAARNSDKRHGMARAARMYLTRQRRDVGPRRAVSKQLSSTAATRLTSCSRRPMAADEPTSSTGAFGTAASRAPGRLTPTLDSAMARSPVIKLSYSSALSVTDGPITPRARLTIGEVNLRLNMTYSQ